MKLYTVKLSDGRRVTVLASSSCKAMVVAKDLTSTFACSAKPL